MGLCTETSTKDVVSLGERISLVSNESMQTNNVAFCHFKVYELYIYICL